MIVTAGELLVEFVSHETGCGLSRVGPYSGPYPSGAPAIFADQAARVGAEVRLFGSTGDDPFGRALRDRLTGDGVDCTGIDTLPDRTTGTAFVSYNADGSRQFVFHIAGTAADRVRATAPDGPFTLFVSGASLSMTAARDTLLMLADRARASGGTVCCDPNVRAELSGDPDAAAALDRIIGLSDILLPSLDDLGHLCPGLDTEAAIAALRGRGPRTIVLKMGASGARLIDDGQDLAVPGHPVTETDPTGAGDCFCGTFLGLIDTGHDAATALEYANAAGAMHVTARGPMEWNPTRPEIERFLEKGPHR